MDRTTVTRARVNFRSTRHAYSGPGLPAGQAPGAVAIVVSSAATLAAGMGVGRFVYTPILPLMEAHASLSRQLGAALATANYVGYLAGAVAGIAVPGLVRSRRVLRISLVVLLATLALMPMSNSATPWLAARLVAGVASALIFMIGASALLTGLRGSAHHLAGWGFGGIGVGIALSGLLVLLVRLLLVRAADTWQLAWWSAVALTAVLLVPAWGLRPEDQPAPAVNDRHGAGTPIRSRWFLTLLISYMLEGVGYIIAGTFLVAAIDQSSPGWVGSGAWILVGLAALPSTALWARLSRTWSRPALLSAALTIQAIGIALPAVVGGVVAALVSASLFGATFLGIATVALATGAHLGVSRAVAILTTAYSAGQILGPVAVTPLLHHGYHQALLLGAGVVAIAALCATALRYRFPHHLGPLPSRLATER